MAFYFLKKWSLEITYTRFGGCVTIWKIFYLLVLLVLGLSTVDWRTSTVGWGRSNLQPTHIHTLLFSMCLCIHLSVYLDNPLPHPLKQVGGEFSVLPHCCVGAAPCALKLLLRKVQSLNFTTTFTHNQQSVILCPMLPHINICTLYL